MSTPLRVLFVGDAEDDALVLVRQLRQGGYQPAFERVETADELRSALHRGGWDVVIADSAMPRFSGGEALAVTLQLAPDVPVVLVAESVGEEEAVEAIRAGAADYVLKPNLVRFVPAVARAVRDAAERKAMRRAEADLRAQRALLGMIYDHTSDALALCTWDPGAAVWTLTSVNRAALDLAKAVRPELDEAGLLGRNAEETARTFLAAGPEADALVADLHRATESGRTRTREARLAAGRDPVYVEITLIPFFGPDGRTRHVLAAVRDVTARNRAGAARREFEARLAESRKMEALGRLAGGVAHDFNNILTGILGFADMVRRSGADPAAAAFGEEILQGANRARDLIRQILMFSRRQPTERRPIRLAEVAREALRLVRGAAPAAVRVTARLPDDGPYILGDPTQLHQVVMNLCTNALQAMGEAGGQLDLTVEGVAVGPEFARRHPPLRPGECVRLAVSDTGPGMPQAVLDRLFEPFFTTKAPGAGTGLGLSVVHGVVQNHDGAIVVDSRPGAGTTFEVYLPAVGAPSRAGEAAESEKPRQDASRRVLFVDDEAPIQRLAQIMLQALGHTVTAFGRPADALAALRADPTAFDLLITDLTMPGMTGVDLAREARADRPDLPIILSSGYADDVPEGTLRSLGIAEVLAKPFQMQALGAAVARATESAEGSR